ncbi:muscleblind-like protein isoform X5 [Hyposmocoma kahamanoa]|uniref:muscleblind-like protein isoform X5 n=1 Tax=Hyposmocoma kahamanoa TaxID=1477025 RepID=UPI000E6D9E99|nr:muscleblind-like protein isoform X5 [Hyposmocoma kahamanoa]
MATMVNMNSLLNGKDSRWLQLEVCREFQRNKCSRPDTECKFAHPPATVEVQNGRVTACYDSIKGRCNREKPPCKYFHPPQHLKDQLLINGRNHLALKNALMQQMGLTPGQVMPGQVPAVVGGVSGAGAAASHLAALDPISLALLAPQATSPYLSGVPGVGSTYAQYYAPQLVPAMLGHDHAAAASPLGVMQQPVLQQKLPRTDRLETAAAAQQPAASAAMEPGKKRPAPAELEPPPMDMKSVGSFYYDNFAFPGVVPYKRPAADKAGVPVYQPATTYQQLMQLQQQPFVPVSCCAPPNAPYVVYTDERGQLLDTLPVCQDFNRQGCTRPTCRFVHIREGCGLQVVGCRVVVCRDAAAGTCRRAACRYYHIPVQLPPALRPP